MRRLWLVALVACSGGAGASSASLVRVSDEPPGANCANGGVAIETGTDSNGDGVLDANEVDSTQYVCNGGGAAATLVDTAPEPPGANCAAGGTAVNIGVDANGNGTLDASEIAQTVYVCNGADGQTALVATEDAGAACPAGGTIVHTGIDTNGDGTLEPSEYQSSTTICNGTSPGSNGPLLDGSYTIGNSIDAGALAGVTHITGTLTVDALGMQHLSLPDLVQVDGGIDIVSNCGSLLGVSMPALTTVGGELSLNGCSSLTTMDFSSLTSAGTLSLVSLPQVTSFATFSSLTSVGDLQIDQLPALTQLDLPLLASAHQVTINGNASLGWLTMPALTSLGGDLSVTSNPVLPTCHATDIRDNLLAHGWTGTATINGTVACVSVDFCRLQYPLDTSAAPNDTLTYYGRWYSAGLTDQTTGIDASTVVRAAAGVGPDGSDPATSTTWTWTAAIPNPAWDGGAAGEPNNDEWQASVSAPAVGAYDTAFRWSGDDGRTWTYCDRNAGPGSDGSQDGYQIANAGSLVVN